MLKWVIVTFCLALIIFGARVAFYLGAFKDVQVTEAVEAPMTLLYKEHMGPYHKIVSHIEEVENWAKANNVDCSRSFGEYLDDPKSVEQERLRGRGGCVVPSAPATIPNHFKIMNYPERKVIKAVFDGSPGIGPYKVYPKIFGYLVDKKLTQSGPMMETYVIHSENKMTTTYLLPIQ